MIGVQPPEEPCVRVGPAHGSGSPRVAQDVLRGLPRVTSPNALKNTASRRQPCSLTVVRETRAARPLSVLLLGGPTGTSCGCATVPLCSCIAASLGSLRLRRTASNFSDSMSTPTHVRGADHLSKSARFRVEQSLNSYPPGYVFPLSFDRRHSLLGHPVPARLSPDGVSTFHTRGETRWSAAFYAPGDRHLPNERMACRWRLCLGVSLARHL